MPRKVNPEAEAEIVLGEGLAGAAPETVMQVRASLPPAPPRFFISGRAKKRMRRLIARANRLRGVAIDARARSRPTRRAFAGGRIALGVAIRRRGRRGSAFMRARAALDPRRLLPRPGVRPFSDHPLLSSGFPFARSAHPRAGLQEVLRALPLHHHGPQGYVTFPHRARVALPPPCLLYTSDAADE